MVSIARDTVGADVCKWAIAVPHIQVVHGLLSLSQREREGARRVSGGKGEGDGHHPWDRPHPSAALPLPPSPAGRGIFVWRGRAVSRYGERPTPSPSLSGVGARDVLLAATFSVNWKT